MGRTVYSLADFLANFAADLLKIFSLKKISAHIARAPPANKCVCQNIKNSTQTLVSETVPTLRHQALPEHLFDNEVPH